MAATVTETELARGRAGDGGFAATEEQLQNVVRAIRTTPIVDNHAHPLLKPELAGRHPLLSMTSEAHGEALPAAVTTLPHHRAVRQLSAVLGCPATWESVVAAIEERRREDYGAWVAQCFDGLETILLDDGLDNEDDVFEQLWHDGFTRSKCRRIVRIEALAAEIISRHCVAFDHVQPLDHVFDNMLEEFDTQIKQALSDPDTVAFKSVICYRTGLAVSKVVDIAAARESFSNIVTSYSASGRPFRRLQHVGLSDLFVHRAAIHIRDSGSRFKKPLQFHTGLGDNDITLTKSSPAHLQEFIRTYPTVPIVLLHAGYPFVRETGYLATVYANVYADIGEVFPAVGRDGQEKIVRQIFELCPWSKVMWSTDGHWFPETYLLAILQIREVLETVVCDLVRKRCIGWRSAIQLTQDILFKNANRVYQLGLDMSEQPGVGDGGGNPRSGLNEARRRSDFEIWEAFLRDVPTPDFVRISWVDYTAMPHMRMIPLRRFNRLVREGQPLDVGIAKAALGMLQNDVCIPSVSGTGAYQLHPDFSSLRAGPMDGHVNLYGEFREEDGSRVPLCPRTQLVRAVELSAKENLSHLVGFEIEFVLLQRTDYTPEAAPPRPRFEALTNDGHAWSLSRFYANTAVAQLLRDIVRDLDAAGIEVEMVHAESAPGQFELILPARPPVEAVDALLHARETISYRATAAGYKFTLHPKPYAQACGTAAHVHMSLSTPDGPADDKELYEKYYAGILEHMPALVAFTYSNPASYERLGDSVWAGGRWVTWGTQNRETPLRKIEHSHWELKCMDGLANPYLALAAVLLAGLSGVVYGTQLAWAECLTDPATLTAEGRKELGITTMLPGSLDDALQALADDETMGRLLGREVVQRYLDIKRAELAFYNGLSEAQLREWIIERY
ncbi:extracellular developmental signal biosynthesis protein [Niveomyces insectorum RCEF 264]|uniref:Glutamine synthetase n=1 Tax=Niveomyces insectorum RCEF 264 TaxID=1081102 RepID=A0A167YRM3_9HYPO|nr:extracellular developmental signal biosynthesis protein [Niveomyces insectorum RCEF 264]